MSPQTRIKEPLGFTKDLEVFYAVIQLVRNNVTTHGHILLGCLTITIIYQNQIFVFFDNHSYQRDAGRRFGLISDTRPTLVTIYWKWRFAVLASPPSLSSIGPVIKWNWPRYQPGMLHSGQSEPTATNAPVARSVHWMP